MIVSTDDYWSLEVEFCPYSSWLKILCRSSSKVLKQFSRLEVCTLYKRIGAWHYHFSREKRENEYSSFVSESCKITDGREAKYQATTIYKVILYKSYGEVCFIFYCTLVSNAKGNLAKSNKSEVWNRLSYRGLPYLFEVRSQTFRNNCKISRSQPQNSTSIVIRPQQPRKVQVRI